VVRDRPDDRLTGAGLEVDAPAAGEHGARWGWLGLTISIITIGAFVWWALRQDPPTIPTSAAALATLAGAVAVYAVATMVRGWRWHMLLRRAHVEHRAGDAYALVPVGYMGNAILPARGGEVLRVVLMANRSPALKREVAGSIVAERLLDGAVLAALFAVLTWIGIAGSPVGQLAGWLAAAGVLVFIGLAALGLRLRRHPRIAPTATKLRPLALATARLLHPWGLGLAVVTAGIWGLEGVVFHMVGSALALPIGWVDGLFLVVLTSFFALIPAGPAYAGTFDTAAVFGLKALDVTGGAAVSFALLVRAVLFVPITLVGLILVVTRYGGWGAVRRARG
jgi:uncharacterized membrane protein YbhN (UPF0104 family)